ncbi:hypothetical protein [Rufibacter latericius]|uniref:Glycosyltransferase RgtA/B/C/D-like domain-containing protein n=1 Tax=Rufibacter latericius TaxID=2487040 RepID=A0A3M9MJN1_9BACT|nr:hypothetical protein [Rufibacter latericius]RNI25772.1 hypothetical protein EFB08_13035 [Rufibacter latericius]
MNMPLMKSSIRLGNSTFALLFTLVYGLLLAWFMSYHEMWFDETEPWLLARYSESYAELLYNKRFEGHPNLWYSLLFVITQFTTTLKALQITQGIFAVGFVYVFLRFAPFSRLIKLLICFGYYGLYEYGIISRLYAIEMLFLFLVCTFYPKRFFHWYSYILLLVLLAQTNLFGFFTAGVLGLLLFSEALGIWKETPNWKSPSVWQKTTGILLWTLGCSFSLWSMVRPNEGNGLPYTFFHPYYVYQAAARVWQAFAPVPEFSTSFWNTSFLPVRLEIPLTALLLVVLFGVFYRTKRLLICLFVLFFALFCLFALKMEGSMRHHAHFFFYTNAFLWLKVHYNQSNVEPAPNKQTPLRQDKFVSFSLPVFGFLQLFAGVYALKTEVEHPFYVGKQVAQFLNTVPTHYILATDEGVANSNITAYIGRPIFNLPTGNLKSYYTLDPYEVNDLRPYVLLDWAMALAKQKQTPVILICRSELPIQWASAPVQPIAIFRKDSITKFAFFLYRIDPLPLSNRNMMAEYPAILKD